EDGDNIDVTDANKHEFVKLVAEWAFTHNTKDQTAAFLKGFDCIVPLDNLQVFDEREIEVCLAVLEA
ncbi:hypothetical protein SARC_16718, partial [Sphaeroforma arctica JP610]